MSSPPSFHLQPIWVGALSAAACCLTAGLAAASDDDGAYGRLDGDLMISGELGVSAGFPGESLVIRTSIHYLTTIGLYGQYNDSLGVDSQPKARSLGSGVEIRPLFLARFVSDLEQGPAYLDLLVDSIALDLGLFGVEPGEREKVEQPDRGWGFGLELGLGIDLPLLSHIDGPFIALRGALRWPLEHEGGPPADDQTAMMGLLSLTLGYHHTFMGHLVDAEPR